MRVRKLALAVGLVSALGGNAALALGLGEVKLNSTLNQPLNAEIALLQTRGLGDNEIRVRLAGPEEFERAGVDRSYLLSELRFDVDYSGAQPVIRITSRAPIREPFLNFLVETRWPSGRLLREYTLLMDLPAFSDSVAQQPVRAAERERQQVRREPPVQPRVEAVAPAQTQPAAAQPEQQAAEAVAEEKQKPAPQETVAEEPMPREAAPQEPLELRREQPVETAAESGSRVYGPVTANQTLWEIARDGRPSRELSVQQTMLAIQRLNPEAFINDNINLLKKGAVLRLPNADEVRSLTLSEAVAEVATQNSSWRQRVGDDAATGAPLDARAAAADNTEADAIEGRVTLAAPGDNESVLSGSGSGAEDSEALAGELAVSEEELDKSRLENAELKDRISELDEQIDTMERLVEVSSDELRAVQTAAEQTAEQSESAPEADAEMGAAEETAAPGAQPEQAAAEEPVEDARNRVVAVQPQPEPTLVDRLMENIQLIGMGAGALLLALFGFFTWRRRQEEEAAMRQVEMEMAAERALAEAPVLGEADENLAAVEQFEAEDSFDLGALDDVETGDPVAEAEIHLSLGQYREAEKKLLAGLETAPKNVDARLMLLEVYAQQQNVDRFDDHYRQLLSVSDGPVADRAARLRETIAGAGTFEAPAMDFSSESLEAAQLDDIGASFDDLSFDSELAGSELTTDDDGFSFDEDDSSLLDELSLDLSPAGDDAQSDGDGDFSLDLELDSDLTLESGSDAQAGAAEEEFNLDDLMGGDLDLDSLDLDGDKPATAEEDNGLDFDLDLSPMADDGESEIAGEELGGELQLEMAESPALDDSDDFDSFDDDLGGLDLDSVDLGEFTESADEELAVADSRAPVAEKPAAAPARPQAAEEDLSDLSFNLESDLDSELNLLEGSDEISTKLELAQAYLDMGDKEGARDILGEVVEEAAGEHKQRARDMLERIS